MVAGRLSFRPCDLGHVDDISTQNHMTICAVVGAKSSLALVYVDTLVAEAVTCLPAGR